MTNFWKCPECGHLNEENLMFCEECGTSKDLLKEKMITSQKQKITEENVNYCPFCGKQISPDDLKCPHCGADLTVEPVETSNVVSVKMKSKKVDYWSSLKMSLIIVGVGFPLLIIVLSILYFLSTMLYLGSLVVGRIAFLSTLILGGLGFTLIFYMATYAIVKELYMGTDLPEPDIFFAIKEHVKLALPYVLLLIFFLSLQSRLAFILTTMTALIAIIFPLIHISRKYIQELKQKYVYDSK